MRRKFTISGRDRRYIKAPKYAGVSRKENLALDDKQYYSID
jgi:hypothetical protein